MLDDLIPLTLRCTYNTEEVTLSRFILLAVLLCTSVVEVWSAREPLWTRKHHTSSVRAASIRDSLGVSNDAKSIVVWSVATGDTIATWSDVDGNFHQAWLSADLKVVYAIVRNTLFWLDITTGARIDSLMLPHGNAFTSEGGQYSTSDLSSDGKRLVVSLNQVQLPHAKPYSLEYVVDLMGKVVKPSYAHSNPTRVRFESGDTRTTAYGRGAWSKRTWSPTGRYAFDGMHLLDYPSSGVKTKLTAKEWFVMRWDVTDALMVGRVDPYNAIGPVCVLNICADTIIDTIASKSYAEHDFWVSHNMRKAVAFSSIGAITVWDIPASLLSDSVCLRSTLPSTLVADSVYDVSYLRFPFGDSVSAVFDRGDGAQPSISSFSSWQSEGDYNARFGWIANADTTWALTRPVIVRDKPLPGHATRCLWTGRYAIHDINTTRSNQILVSTAEGRTLLVNNDLLCTRGFGGARIQYGVVWHTADTIIRLRRFDSSSTEWRGSITSFTYAIVQKIPVEDFVPRSENRVNTSITTPGPSTTLHMRRVESANENDLWFSFATTSEGRDGGGLLSVDPYSLLFSPRAHLTTQDWPRVIGFRAAIGGCKNKAGTLALSFNRMQSRDNFYNDGLVAIDLKTDTALAFIKAYPDHGLFITDIHAIVDGLILYVPYLMVTAEHRFKGPYARSIPEGHAIAWDSGMFYYIGINGSLVDSMPGPSTRPTVIRALSNKVVITGHLDGTIQMFGGTVSNVESDEQQSNHNAPPSELTVNVDPTNQTLHVSSCLPITSTPASITMVDLTGRMVAQWTLPPSDRYDINLNGVGLSSGLYLIQLEHAGHITSGKCRIVQ